MASRYLPLIRRLFVGTPKYSQYVHRENLYFKITVTEFKIFNCGPLDCLPWSTYMFPIMLNLHAVARWTRNVRRLCVQASSVASKANCCSWWSELIILLTLPVLVRFKFAFWAIRDEKWSSNAQLLSCRIFKNLKSALIRSFEIFLQTDILHLSFLKLPATSVRLIERFQLPPRINATRCDKTHYRTPRQKHPLHSRLR